MNHIVETEYMINKYYFEQLLRKTIKPQFISRKAIKLSVPLINPFKLEGIKRILPESPEVIKEIVYKNLYVSLDNKKVVGKEDKEPNKRYVTGPTSIKELFSLKDEFDEDIFMEYIPVVDFKCDDLMPQLAQDIIFLYNVFIDQNEKVYKLLENNDIDEDIYDELIELQVCFNTLVNNGYYGRIAVYSSEECDVEEIPFKSLINLLEEA